VQLWLFPCHLQSGEVVIFRTEKAPGIPVL
jgi:hypothetical protein